MYEPQIVHIYIVEMNLFVWRNKKENRISMGTFDRKNTIEYIRISCLLYYILVHFEWIIYIIQKQNK